MTVSERALVSALKAVLAPIPVHWGWAPLESAFVPASLPLVTVQRLQYLTAGYETMCDGEPYMGDTVIVIHAWAANYEAARDLAADVRATMAQDAEGWRLQSEGDLYEPAFRAWRIEGQWLASGVPPD
jgi:hypothetical protein